MPSAKFKVENRHPQVVGSFGRSSDLQKTDLTTTRRSCDLAEIRLDILMHSVGSVKQSQWKHLLQFPLLFTTRRIEEGGALALSARQRMELLVLAMNDAALIDIEIASLSEMSPTLRELESQAIPWIASFHDFDKLPDLAILKDAALKARDAGALIFKVAARLACPDDVAKLADFQLTDHGIPIASMGMGHLAPASRLLCAQCGSCLNYGYLGSVPTAPGQWDSHLLKQAIARSVMI